TSLPAARLADHLIGGVSYVELPDELGGEFLRVLRDRLRDQHEWILPPLPNTRFIRDDTSWICGGVTLRPMYWPARRPTTGRAAASARFRRRFVGERASAWVGALDGPAGTGSRSASGASLGGGDGMPIGNGTAPVGMGERTSSQAITRLASNLFA